MQPGESQPLRHAPGLGSLFLQARESRGPSHLRSPCSWGDTRAPRARGAALERGNRFDASNNRWDTRTRAGHLGRPFPRRGRRSPEGVLGRSQPGAGPVAQLLLAGPGTQALPSRLAQPRSATCSPGSPPDRLARSHRFLPQLVSRMRSPARAKRPPAPTRDASGPSRPAPL